MTAVAMAPDRAVTVAQGTARVWADTEPATGRAH